MQLGMVGLGRMGANILRRVMRDGHTGVAYDTSALFRSMMGGSALNGPLVSAPSEPAPVVDGDLPVMLEINSMKSSGSGR